MDERPEMFGAELRRLRLAAGLSLGELARSVHYSKGYLSKIETGQKPGTVDLARRCGAALGTSGRLSELVEPASPEKATPSIAPPGDQEVEGLDWMMNLSPQGTGWFAPTKHTDAPATTAAALLTLGVSEYGGAHATQRETTHDAFAAMFELHRRIGRTVTPAAVLPSVIAQTYTLRELAGAAEPKARNRLLCLAARYAEFTGWMAQEAGHDQAATWWTYMAVDMAKAAGHHEFAAHSLVRTALVAMLREDAAQTVELTDRAQADRRVSPRVRGLAALREAQGHALAGDDLRCHRTLDRAVALLDRARSDGADGDLALGPARVAEMGPLVTGWCLYDLGNAAEAAQILDDQVPRIPVGGDRAKARFGVRRALAHAAAGDLDRACHLAGSVLDEVELVDSATVRVDLRRLSRMLTRWRNHAPVRELQPQLAAALHVPVRLPRCGECRGRGVRQLPHGRWALGGDADRTGTDRVLRCAQRVPGQQIDPARRGLRGAG